MSTALKRRLVEASLKVVTPDYCIATWSSVLVLIWRVNTTMDAVAAVRHEIEALGRAHPQGIGLLTIVEQAAPVPSSEARNGLARTLADFGKIIRHSAVVHEGSGFRAAAIRGVVTGLTMLARPPYPHKVFSTLDSAALWLASGLRAAGIDCDAEDLSTAVRDVRVRVAAS